MQHINKKTSNLKKSTIAHNSIEELRLRLRISSVASSTFFAQSDESSTAEASSTIELGSDTFYARSDDSSSGEGSGTEKHGSNFGYAQSDDGSSAEAIRKRILPSRGRGESQHFALGSLFGAIAVATDTQIIRELCIWTDVLISFGIFAVANSQ
jgi:hypothetical protein